MEETKKPLEPEDDEVPCSILEYKWGKSYSDEKLLEFGEKNLISSNCVDHILRERDKKREK